MTCQENGDPYCLTCANATACATCNDTAFIVDAGSGKCRQKVCGDLDPNC